MLRWITVSGSFIAALGCGFGGDPTAEAMGLIEAWSEENGWALSGCETPEAIAEDGSWDVSCDVEKGDQSGSVSMRRVQPGEPTPSRDTTIVGVSTTCDSGGICVSASIWDKARSEALREAILPPGARIVDLTPEGTKQSAASLGMGEARLERAGSDGNTLKAEYKGTDETSLVEYDKGPQSAAGPEGGAEAPADDIPEVRETVELAFSRVVQGDSSLTVQVSADLAAFEVATRLLPPSEW